jgi:hypothetical protein
VIAMISDNLIWDSKHGYNLIEYEEGDSLPVKFNSRHGLGPLSKLFYDHDNKFYGHNILSVKVGQLASTCYYFQENFTNTKISKGNLFLTKIGKNKSLH